MDADPAKAAAMRHVYEIAEAIRGADARYRSSEWFREQILKFADRYSALGVTISDSVVWWRARRPPRIERGKRYESLLEMLYPPGGNPDYGRAQTPGTKVVYASLNPLTALEEVGAQVGDLAQMVGIRPIEGREAAAHVVGEYASDWMSGANSYVGRDMKETIRTFMATSGIRYYQSLFIDSFMADLFRNPSSQYYKATACFAEQLYKHDHGVIYPSVRAWGSPNIAIPAADFDRNWEVVVCDVLEIQDMLGYGIFHSVRRHAASDFQPSGEIIWDGPNPRSMQRVAPNFLYEVSRRPGWRKPDARVVQPAA